MLGKVVLITGSTSGIGLEAAKQFYRLGATVLLTCRDSTRGRNAVDSVLSNVTSTAASGDHQRISLYSLDLMSYDSILSFCKEVLTDWKHIDSLVLNAGIMKKSFELSSDGIESHFATNMFGHYVIVNQLYSILSNGSEAGRIIVISSGLYTNCNRLPTLKQLMGEQHWEDYNPNLCYSISKLANCLYTKEISRKLHDLGNKVAIFALRPGFIPGTELGRETHWILRLLASPIMWLFSQPITKAVDALVHLSSTDLSELQNGSLYNFDCREEDYNDMVNQTNCITLLQILCSMDDIVLGRSDFLSETKENIKKKRDWLVNHV